MKTFKIIYAVIVLVLAIIMVACLVVRFINPQLATKLHWFFISLMIAILVMTVLGAIIKGFTDDEDDNDYYSEPKKKRMWTLLILSIVLLVLHLFRII